MKGFFGNLFDFNHDGKHDSFGQAADIALLASLAENGGEEEQTELEMAGLDPEELEFMDEDERREALEDAGLDPDEYDF